MHCIIAGSRTITAEKGGYELVVRAVQDSTFLITEVISGHAQGVDQLGEQWAQEHQTPLKIMPAEWAKYGKSAGIRRNGDMARYALNRDKETAAGAALVLVWDGQSKGSASMLATAHYFGLRIFQHIVPPSPLPNTCPVQPDLF